MSTKLQKKIILNEGTWIITQNIYYIKNKNIKNEQNIITALKTNKNSQISHSIYYTELDKTDLILFSDTLIKTVTNRMHYYKILNDKCIYVKIKKYKNHALYTEYIYKLNNNVQISIGLLNNATKIIAISFMTYIKKNTNKS